MKSSKTKKIFSARLWKYDGPAGWYFVTLPKKLAQEIRKQHQSSEEGWGRLKVRAKIKNTAWDTAIWFDTKAKSYLLPIKAPIRKKESIAENQRISVELFFESLSPKESRWLKMLEKRSKQD